MALRSGLIASICAAVSTVTLTVSAQSGRRLTIDAIYDPEHRINFSGAPPTGLRWIDDKHYVERVRDGGRIEWVKAEALSGGRSTLVDSAAMARALADIAGTSPADAAHAISRDVVFDSDWTDALIAFKDDLYLYDVATKATVRLTDAPGTEEEATFSPDGRRVAFVRANNLFVVDVTTRREIALTSDGTPQILNGKLDWLYQEEIYGRGRFRGYWWSHDSTRVAFLQLDERPVPEYTIVDDISYRPTVEVTDYPKAGDPNPLARVGIVSADGGTPLWVQLDSYAANDMLVVDVDWQPNAGNLIVQIQNREQTWLDLNRVDVASGRVTRVLRETTPAWVNVNGSAIWLVDGSFLWLSERNGFKHLYHYRGDGILIRQITTGRWDIRALYGIDETNGLVYFDAGARRHIDTDIYSSALDGRNLTRLSRTAGTHRAIFNRAFTHYIDVWSDVSTPTQVRLHSADGMEVRVIAANPVPALADYRLARPEFVEVLARDGFMMDAMIIKPPDFSPARRYPVFQFTYAGPGAASVRNQWGGSAFIYHQLLAQHGAIVWVLDNRSASGKGAESQWPVYGRLGEQELQDLEDGIAWLKQQRYVDPSRIVLHGWSYGGFMTTYAMTHSTSWTAGIAGAPVTDWRNYDTVYTERYMKTPEHNPEGYRRTAPRFAAARLHGRLLLIHGSVDDNVHRQNSEQFAFELQRAGKPFEMMMYPTSRHGVTDEKLNKHLRQMMLEFIVRTAGLGPVESRGNRTQ